MTFSASRAFREGSPPVTREFFSQNGPLPEESTGSPVDSSHQADIKCKYLFPELSESVLLNFLNVFPELNYERQNLKANIMLTVPKSMYAIMANAEK